MAINIGSSHLQEIKSAIGFPVITNLDWSGDTDDYVKEYIVTRVLRTYFTYFPIKVVSNQSISGEFTIAYPETDVFKMLKHFFNYKNVQYSNISPFILQTLVMSRAPHFTDFASGQMSEVINRMSTAESVVDWTRALRIDDDPRARQVTGFSNTSGDITIEWAKKSEDFDNIIYNYIDDAIKLGKAFLMQDTYRLREQIKVSTKIEINTEALLADANKWEEEVLTKWKQRGYAVVITN